MSQGHTGDAIITVQPHEWGKDHWSVLAYIEDRCVNSSDNVGVPQLGKLQTNHDRHGHLAGRTPDGSAYGIRLANGDELPGHLYDDWDCLDDFVREGYLEDVGTGLHRAYTLTAKGADLAGRLRQHKSQGGTYASFNRSLRPLQT